MKSNLLKTKEEIEVLREGGRILAKILDEISHHVSPGVTTKGLDTLAESLIISAGGTPSFKGYRVAGAPVPYPASLCTSINDEVVHGIPSDRVLKEGDIIGLDIGMQYNKLFTDMAVTLPVGVVDKKLLSLIDVARESLHWGISAAKPGGYTGDIGSAVQRFVEDHDFGVVRQLIGHGVGYKVHEDPEVPNFGKKNSGTRLSSGMVLAIEPMVTAGDWHVRLADDGWTWLTKDGSYAAHFEHTIVITENGAEVLTLL